MAGPFRDLGSCGLQVTLTLLLLFTIPELHHLVLLEFAYKNWFALCPLLQFWITDEERWAEGVGTLETSYTAVVLTCWKQLF